MQTLAHTHMQSYVFSYIPLYSTLSLECISTHSDNNQPPLTQTCSLKVKGLLFQHVSSQLGD